MQHVHVALLSPHPHRIFHTPSSLGTHFPRYICACACVFVLSIFFFPFSNLFEGFLYLRIRVVGVKKTRRKAERVEAEA